MKSKTCLCNGTILRKDLTRFAPLMLGTGLLLWFVGWSVSMTYDLAYQEIGAEIPMEPVSVFLLFTSLMGLVSALCLFGYLMKKRECDAMHALPLRRETLFFTHCIAALIQFVIPFAILYAFMPGNRGWAFQMGFTLCAWLFYFGLAVFSLMLAGRKLGGLMIFWLLSDLLSNLYTMVDCLYIPQLPGLYLDEELALTLTPSGHMISLDFVEGSFGELLLPMGLYALGGVALLFAALKFYQKRKLERAEDFLAERWLEPVFAWGLGITGACFLVSIFGVMGLNTWVSLILGLAIGYFAARMLFARSVKVFQKKGLLGFAALVAVIAGSVFLVSLDPLGVVRKVPAMEQIESITLSDALAFNYSYSTGSCELTDPEEIEAIRTIHQEIVSQEEIPMPDVLDEDFYLRNDQFYLLYQLKDGSALNRIYWIEDEEHLAQFEYIFSQPEHLVGTDSLEVLLVNVSELEAYGTGGGMIHTRRGFLEVFLKDCEAGNMYCTDYEDNSAWTVSMYICVGPNGERQYVSIDVPKDAENTVAWLEDYFH